MHPEKHLFLGPYTISAALLGLSRFTYLQPDDGWIGETARESFSREPVKQGNVISTYRRPQDVTQGSIFAEPL